ncbi:TPA: V-type ATP synthase subunit A [Candidatus Poribacteria bacterium]|nr:V-type ATP synthase subunit A [Candidatus Poribacteria bacterium]HEX30204.1 V-type ATP synthase subunit A [Candidatus Poribacteria bacterium]
MREGRIIKVSGPLIVAEGLDQARMFDVVRVSEKRLIGEIIEIRGDRAWIQVYEETSGIGPGEPVFLTGEPLSVELGPGLIESIYDGVQRPLDTIRDMVGDYITRGVDVPGLNRERKWGFTPTVKRGDRVVEGDVIGEVQESTLVVHRIMIPPGVSGVIDRIEEGEFTVEETVAVVKTDSGELEEIRMMQRWPVRQPRPVKQKLSPSVPLVTGQRITDTLFPVAKGGTAAIPGPFGSGKTVFLHQLAKWADAQIIIYVGCGERGNEMTDVLMEFPELTDPKSGEPLMRRTVLIANTSNMPVAAREASVYTGVTIGEYFRDMGYSVALMADSTSRWAEAMREISGRLEEMPGEEGYPAYLGTRIAEFYERSGRVQCLGGDNREGALSIIGAVSPPGGDLSDPVVQATLRVVKVFWSLDAELAYQRHFPAINWLRSYSLYLDNLEGYYKQEIGEEWIEMRNLTMWLLEREAELMEIVRLVGLESISPENRLIMEGARSVREDFLHQNAFHDVDTYTSLEKQYKMLDLVLTYYRKGQECLKRGVPIDKIVNLEIREEIARCKFLPEEQMERIDDIKRRLIEQMDALSP